jgi:hypothetical protein
MFPRGHGMSAGRAEAEPMQNLANSAPGATAVGGKKSLRERAVSELEKYAVITVYLWLLFALFGLYRRQVLLMHGISAWQQGFAIVNALVFGKVILIAQAFELGKSLEKRILAWIVLGKSLIFAIVLIAFHIGEEAIRAWFEGKPLADGAADFGGTPSGLLTYAAIFFILLIPFFAFQETARVLGSGALWSLFFRRGAERFRLVQE